jgi:hypothetical protein
MMMKKGIYYVNDIGEVSRLDSVIPFYNYNSKRLQLQVNNRELFVDDQDITLVKETTKGNPLGICQFCKSNVYPEEQYGKEMISCSNKLSSYCYGKSSRVGWLYTHKACNLEQDRKQSVPQRPLKAARRARRWARYKKWLIGFVSFLDRS